MKWFKTIGGIVGAMACLVMAMPVNAQILTIGDFSQGMDGWTADHPSSDMISVYLHQFDAARYEMNWTRVNGVFTGSVNIKKTWSATEQPSNLNKLSISNYVKPGTAIWCGWIRAHFASDGSTHDIAFYWPVQHSTLVLTSATFGVSQAAFSTMDSLEFSMVPDSANNTGDTQVMDWAVGDIQLSSDDDSTVLSIGDFSKGQDGWVPVADAPEGSYTIAIVPANRMLEMDWGRDGTPFEGYVKIQKSWDATGQAATYNKLTFNNYVAPSAAIWAGYITVHFAADGSTHGTTFYWPVQNPYVALSPEVFGVSQQVFTTMDSLTFSMTPESANNTGGTNELNWAVGNVKLIGPGSPVSVSDVKIKSDGFSPSCTGTVTATGKDYFYIENSDRCSGIRIHSTISMPSVGNTVTVMGNLGTMDTGERYIDALNVDVQNGAPLKPLAMNNKAIGGGTVGVPPLGQIGVDGGTGINNIGMFITTTGNVSDCDTASSRWYKITDGSGRDIKVIDITQSGKIASKSQYVVVTGVVSLETTTEGTVPTILATSFYSL